MDADHKILVGKIVGVWGVKGWVKLHSFTRNRTDISDYTTWVLKSVKDEFRKVVVTNCRQQGQGIVAQLVGVNDRDQAMTLAGSSIYVEQQALPELDEGEYYWQDLIGLSVYDNQQMLIGEVESIFETGANDVLVVKQQTAGELKEVLIPYTPEVVTKVDLKSNAMTVDWDVAWLDD